MPRELTPGQRAAMRRAKARRGELGLSQKELAKRSGVGERTIQNFENEITWMRADKLAQLERLGLQWPVGYLTEYAARYREQNGGPSTLDEDVESILSSNLHPDLKLRLIDTLRSIEHPPTTEELREELAELERRTAPDGADGKEFGAAS